MRPRRFEAITVLLPAAIGLAASAFASDGTAYFVAQLLVICLFAAAFDLAYGMTGIFSMGHAAFFGGGAYAYSMCSTLLGWGFPGSVAAGVVAGAVLATLFGLLAMRATGLYFALATLALGQLVNILIEVKLRAWTGGSDGLSGIPRPVIFGHSFGSTAAFLAFTSACFVPVMALLAMLRASGYGQALKAVRDNPVRASQIGYDVNRYRISAYAISGALSGFAGCLYAMLTMFVSPDYMRWSMSGDVLIMTVLGGAGTLAGPMLGVTVFEVAKELISRYTEHWYGVLGVLFVACTLFLPKGIHGLFSLERLRRPGQDPAATGRGAAPPHAPLEHP